MLVDAVNALDLRGFHYAQNFFSLKKLLSLWWPIREVFKLNEPLTLNPFMHSLSKWNDMPLLGLREGTFCFYSLYHWMCVQFYHLLLARLKRGTAKEWQKSTCIQWYCDFWFMLFSERDYVNSLSLWETLEKWLFQKLLPSFQGRPYWDKSDRKMIYRTSVTIWCMGLTRIPMVNISLGTKCCPVTLI